MKVLWVVNTIFPDLAKRIGRPVPVFGGWMYGAAAMLASSPSVSLSVATIHAGESLFGERIGSTDYYLLSGNGNLTEQWREIVKKCKPDVIHVHGTEYAHGLALLRLAPEIPSVVSIQGLVSIIARYYLAGLTTLDVLRNITFRDIVRMDTLFQQRGKMAKRGEAEREYIKRASMIMGRTDWDRAHVEAIRPGVPYVHCDEMLRDEFYCEDRWTHERCKPSSIFVSQGSYPIKGLHQLVKAAALIKRRYPEVEIRVAGLDIIDTSSWRARLRLAGYGKYLRNLIAANGLQDGVNFLGLIDAGQMKDEYLRCNVSVCPSAIENGSNSIAEAQILGVPVIASQVGGIATMTDSFTLGQSYRFDEPEMLAMKLHVAFSRGAEMADPRSVTIARLRHDRARIRESLLRAYSQLASGCVEAMGL